jgi:hypothetical protein
VGLFSRRKDPTRDLARAIATRGVRVRGMVEAFDVEGDVAVARVRFRPEGAAADTVVTIRQAMPPQVQVGLEPGAPVSLSYDRDDPTAVVIWGSPLYRTTETGAVVRAVDVEGGERA